MDQIAITHYSATDGWDQIRFRGIRCFDVHGEHHREVNSGAKDSLVQLSQPPPPSQHKADEETQDERDEAEDAGRQGGLQVPEGLRNDIIGERKPCQQAAPEYAQRDQEVASGKGAPEQRGKGDERHEVDDGGVVLQNCEGLLDISDPQVLLAESLHGCHRRHGDLYFRCVLRSLDLVQLAQILIYHVWGVIDEVFGGAPQVLDQLLNRKVLSTTSKGVGEEDVQRQQPLKGEDPRYRGEIGPEDPDGLLVSGRLQRGHVELVPEIAALEENEYVHHETHQLDVHQRQLRVQESSHCVGRAPDFCNGLVATRQHLLAENAPVRALPEQSGGPHVCHEVAGSSGLQYVPLLIGE
eukprot:RCo002039